MTKTTIEIKRNDGNIFINIDKLGIATKKEGNSYTVFCPSLKVIGYSNKNEKDAFNDFEDNLSIFFTVHIKDNTLDRALTDFEWNKKELTLNQTIKAVREKRKISPKIEFINKNTPALHQKDFKVPVYS